MPYLPANTEWFLAEILLNGQVGDHVGELRINWVLIKANDIETAYRKAIKWGESQNISYTNPENEPVRFSFLGLKDLNIIYDPLEDGAELLEERVGEATEERIRKLVTPKEQLWLFQPEKDRT